MRLEERRTLVVLILAGVVGAVLFLPALYFVGLWLAPPRPVPAAAAAPSMIRQALWARADGGRNTELRPLTPLRFISHRICRALAARHDDPTVRAAKRLECLHSLPAIQAADYLSGVHLRDQKMEERSLRTELSQVATAAWMTRSWTADDLLDTLAERGEYGFGWRGVAAAARGYFNRPAAELSLPQAALVAAFVGDRGTDPWCEPEAARELRNRILGRMRDNGAITGTAFTAAVESPVELGPPPPDRSPCG